MAAPALGPQVPVRSPDGKLGTVPASEADEAVRQGFEPVSVADYHREQLEQQYGGFGGFAKAGVEGAARGLTLGLSDLALRGVGGEEWRQGAAARKELFPGTELAGEVAGTVAPVLFSGGSSLAGRAAGAAGAIPRGVAALGGLAERGVGALVGEGAAGLGARALQAGAGLAARGAVEGALYGAGQGITEAALGDPDLTAEKLFAAMGEHAKDGAVLGAITGGAVGAIGEVGKSAAKAAFRFASEGSLGDFFRSFADERTIKALGATKSDIQRMGGRAGSAEAIEARMGEVAQTVRDYEFEDGSKLFRAGDSIDNLAEKTSRAVEEQGKRLASIREELGGALKARPELGPDVQGLLDKVDADVLAPLRDSNVASIQGRADKVEKEIAGLRSRLAPSEELSPELAQLRSASPEAFEKLKASNPDLASKLAPKPVSLEELTQFRKDLDSVIYPKARGATGLPPLPPEHLAELQQVRGLVEGEIEQATERAAGAAGNPKLLGDYLDAKQKFSALKTAEQLTAKGVAKEVGNRFFSPTDYAAGGIGAMMHGGPVGIATGLAGAAVHHVVRERGSSVLAVAADRIAQLSERAGAIDDQISRGVDRILSAGKTVEAKAAAMAAPTLHPLPAAKRDDLDAVRARLAAASTDPNAALEHIGHTVAPFADAAPQTAAAVTQTAMRAAQYLAKQLPPPRQPTGLEPVPSKVDPVAKAKFARASRGANQPMTILADMQRGRASREQVEATKAVAPKLHAAIVEQITSKAIERAADGKHPGYQARVQASILTGQPMDRTMTPAFVRAFQEMHRAAAGGGQKQPGAALGPTPKRKVDIAGGFRPASESRSK